MTQDDDTPQEPDLSEPSQGSLEELTEEPDPGRPSTSSGGGVSLNMDASCEPAEPAPIEEFIRYEPLDPDAERLGFDLIDTFFFTAEDLLKHPAVHEVTRQVERRAPELTLTVIERGLGHRLPDEIASLYRLADQMELRWSWRDRGELRLGGELNLLTAMRVFGSWLGTFWPEDEPPEGDEHALAMHELRWKLRPFDAPEQPDTLWGALMIDEETLQDAPYALYVCHATYGALPLRLGFIDYMYCALGARAMPGWQLLFTDYDFELNPWQVEHPTAWLDRLAMLFPDSDHAFFRAQLRCPTPPV